MRFTSLQTRLIIVFGLCLLVAIGVVAIYGIISYNNTTELVINSSSEIATSTAKALLGEEAKSISYSIRIELESALDTTRTLADVLSGIKDLNVDLRIDRQKINGILRSVLVRNQTFLAAYTLWEPDALDGLDELYVGKEGYDQTGRFITYWGRNESGQVQHKIPLDYDNHKTDENGVRKGEYYLLPYEQKRECAIDPYPYSAQSQTAWITSLVVPIMVDNRFYGIVGVDIQLDFIQSLLEEVNRELYSGVGRMAIVSHNGILAAASDKPELVGKHLKHWMPEDWEKNVELLRSGKEEIAFQNDNLEITIPLQIGRTQTPWAVFIEIPNEAVLADVYNLERELKTRGRNNLLWQVGVGLGIILIAFVIIGFVSRGITRPLKVAAAVATQVSEGNLGVQFASTSKDEVGQVLRAMEQMIVYLQEVADVAEKISTNDLQIEIAPKSEQDILNHALIKMVTNLQTMTNEIDRSMTAIEQQYNSIKEQNWSKDGTSQLSAVLAGDHSMAETCDTAISFVARYVNAGQGVLYTYKKEEEMLHLNGSYAFTERDGLSNHYKVGEGIIGQVALERSPILLKHLDLAERLIHTATVSEAPLNTYTVPLIYNDELYGVLELASFEAFDEKTQELIQQANSVIATALFAVSQRERAQELVQLAQQAAQEAEHAKEDAQRQAVEAQRVNTQMEEQQQQLQQQNEEFQQLNAQLKEQQQQLQQEIKEREQVQHKLAEERNLIQKLVDILPDYIYVKDRNNRFILANRTLAVATGFSTVNELLGKTDFDIHPKELAEQFYKYEQVLMQSNQSIQEKEEIVEDKRTGEKIWLLTTKMPFRDPQGQIAGIIGIGRNITDRKQVEEELQKLKDELENRP